MCIRDSLYTYCHNEPIMYVDPTGHIAASLDENGNSTVPDWLDWDGDGYVDTKEERAEMDQNNNRVADWLEKLGGSASSSGNGAGNSKNTLADAISTYINTMKNYDTTKDSHKVNKIQYFHGIAVDTDLIDDTTVNMINKAAVPQPGDKFPTENDACLLYTSRCV